MLNNQLISTGYNLYKTVINYFIALSDSIPPLLVRLFLAWEFGEAGFEKLHGTNWFAGLDFPFPFNLLSPDISWGIATFFEIVGAFALAFGIATRFFTLSLMILTVVAVATVHWPEHLTSLSELLIGYRFIDEEGDGFGNYKLPLIYLVMLLPLLFAGSGKLSVDRFVNYKVQL
ncbi:MAG: DoxX family protein [Methylotenera sp.]|nr:DoxX family protein [Methylotenera sp.]MDP1767133.1 DoxX family protein [Methylotenera sp.]